MSFYHNILSSKISGSTDGGENKLPSLVDRTVTEITEDDLRGATKISSYAFYKCEKLVSVTIPEGVTEISERPFGECRALQKIVIPKSMAKFSNYAFYGLTGTSHYYDMYIKDVNSWVNITIVPGNTVEDDVYPRQAILHFMDNDGNEITNIAVPEGVENLRKYIFSGGCNLVSIYIPNTVTTIGSHAFYACYDLKSVNLPESITTINAYTFFKCRNLVNIDIPKGVESIGTNVFSECHSLKDVILRSETICTLANSGMFSSCYHISGMKNSTYNPTGAKDGYFYVPRALVEDYKIATNWSTYSTQFRALEDYTVDGTITGELDPNKI